MIVTDDAFDELLDRVEQLERESKRDADPDEEEVEARRRQFAIAVDRAVKTVVVRTDQRPFHTQTLKRYGCRLHFLRNGPTFYLYACLPLEDGDEDYST